MQRLGLGLLLVSLICSCAKAPMGYRLVTIALSPQLSLETTNQLHQAAKHLPVVIARGNTQAATISIVSAQCHSIPFTNVSNYRNHIQKLSCSISYQNKKKQLKHLHSSTHVPFNSDDIYHLKSRLHTYQVKLFEQLLFKLTDLP